MDAGNRGSLEAALRREPDVDPLRAWWIALGLILVADALTPSMTWGGWVPVWETLGGSFVAWACRPVAGACILFLALRRPAGPARERPIALIAMAGHLGAAVGFGGLQTAESWIDIAFAAAMGLLLAGSSGLSCPSAGTRPRRVVTVAAALLAAGTLVPVLQTGRLGILSTALIPGIVWVFLPLAACVCAWSALRKPAEWLTWTPRTRLAVHLHVAGSVAIPIIGLLVGGDLFSGHGGSAIASGLTGAVARAAASVPILCIGWGGSSLVDPPSQAGSALPTSAAANAAAAGTVSQTPSEATS